MGNVECSTQVNKLFHVKLQTLSPVAINSGETLSYPVNYFILNNRVHYLTEDDWINLLTDETLQDELELSMEAGYFVKDFEQIVAKDKKSSRGISIIPDIRDIRGKRLSVVMKSNGKPYIPGSTLKGAIMNAVLYSWLKENPDELSRLINVLKTKDIKDFDGFDEALGVKQDALYQASSFFGVSDSNSLDIECLCIDLERKLYRESQKEKERVASLQEFIKPNRIFDLQLFFITNNVVWENQPDSYFKKAIYQQENMKSLFRLINTFSQDYLEFESERMQKSGFENICNIRSLRIPSQPNEALLCIGSGKSFFMNTLALAIRKSNPTFFQTIVKQIYSNHNKPSDFPYMHSIIDNQLPGWVRLIDTDMDSYQEQLEKSYTEAELKSGNPIEGIIEKFEGGHVCVSVLVDGNPREINVSGKGKFEKQNTTKLKENTKCIFFYRDDSSYNFIR